MNNVDVNEFIRALLKKVDSFRGREIVFFVVGRAGWGKSSTINSLVGQQVCPVSDNEATTTEVTEHRFNLNNVTGIVFDTPGFCDGSGNDHSYIQMIRSKIIAPDLMLYVNRLDETRITDNDKRGVSLISSALGKKIWENTVIIFTFADKVKPSDYEAKLKKRTQLVRQVIAECIKDQDLAEKIPVVAINNEGPKTPDGKEWLGEFFTVVADRLAMEGVIAFLSMLTPVIKTRVNFNKKQKEIIRKKFVDSVLQNLSGAAGVGVIIAALMNAPAIIGFSAAGIAGTLIGAWLSKDNDE